MQGLLGKILLGWKKKRGQALLTEAPGWGKHVANTGSFSGATFLLMGKLRLRGAAQAAQGPKACELRTRGSNPAPSTSPRHKDPGESSMEPPLISMEIFIENGDFGKMGKKEMVHRWPS